MFGAKGRKVGRKEMNSRRNIYTCIFENRYMKMEKERGMNVRNGEKEGTVGGKLNQCLVEWLVMK